MTLPRAATLTGPALATGVIDARPIVLPRLLRRAAEVVGDLLALAGIALCLPFVIVAIGIPFALCVRLVLWVVEVTR